MKTLQFAVLWFLLPLSSVVLIAGQDIDSMTSAKQKALDEFRNTLKERSFRTSNLKNAEDVNRCIELLDADGYFSDLRYLNDQWDQLNTPYVSTQNELSKPLQKAFTRLWKIAELYRNEKLPEGDAIDLRNRVFKGFSNYMQFERDRPLDTGRFHASCFAMPRAGSNAYFCFFDVMEGIENGEITDSVLVEGRQAMIDLGCQAWTIPARNDATDSDVVSVDRFRKHVWWVGGNGLAYRNLSESAATKNSVEMMDVIAEVAQKGISAVSQTTYDDAFWTEGMTADGAGWGHGMQCLVWGYPIHGTSAALDRLKVFRGTPWAQKLSEENVSWLLNLLRGSSFLYHRGIAPPCLGRGSMQWEDLERKEIPSARIAKGLLADWSDSFSPEELAELKQFCAEAESLNILMSGYPDGNYHGTRYFFNNDNFVKKNEDYYSIISMASVRCDGIESAHVMADMFNFYTCDGMTFFQRTGEEYKLAVGAWNLTAIPGVTSRQVDALHPITNWRGFCSKRNFAAGATDGGDYAVTGFIFEKMNASAKKDVNDKSGLNEKNKDIYGVLAHKGYFWFGDVLLVLGSGVTDLDGSIERPIWTTIEQTIVRGENRIAEQSMEVAALSEPVVYEIEDRGELQWVTNNGFGYAVIPEYTTGSVFASFQKRETQWDEINFQNRSIESEPEELDIFQMWIDHGNHPQNDTYAYYVSCSGETVTDLPVVLSNSTDLQAAVSSDGNVIEALFYSADEKLMWGDNSIKVSSECALMVKSDHGAYSFTVCDAKMDVNLDELIIQTDLDITGENVEVLNGKNILTIDLPREPFRGKPVTVVCSKRSNHQAALEDY
ncbi:polysaccharide lyase family 8 super-sandwich domain-containing protein [Rubellicoccus peritrichatus]|uniref:Polysaccharide lyase family 8 super-sandwich domain-containing protein n=1 Tax=Rubellicoccus peritrichatus TaxID=3080537 RepID=A0AAQ3QXU6_9BACT|nr:polysaccharide lyase family 8 super-sandwich domain-containing protein [Puniceicoccus sp. CR14]WOO43412.1 polysaccharide lyase family 8 super-sandwich domain-containing protein [Puniceicoccus sp. CR14]